VINVDALHLTYEGNQHKYVEQFWGFVFEAASLFRK
jgi:hypothetical protein